MARFSAYAEVLTPENPLVEAYTSGAIKQPPGVLLRTVLEYMDKDGNYSVELSNEFRADIRRVAELTNDRRLVKISEMSAYPVPVKHVLGGDPDTTRILLGHSLDYTAEESERLRVPHSEPYDPRKAFLIERDS